MTSVRLPDHVEVAAIVRPDHDMFAMAVDAADLAARLDELAMRL